MPVKVRTWLLIMLRDILVASRHTNHILCPSENPSLVELIQISSTESKYSALRTNDSSSHHVVQGYYFCFFLFNFSPLFWVWSLLYPITPTKETKLKQDQVLCCLHTHCLPSAKIDCNFSLITNQNWSSINLHLPRRGQKNQKCFWYP